jgi:hypothetical protein
MPYMARMMRKRGRDSDLKVLPSGAPALLCCYAVSVIGWAGALSWTLALLDLLTLALCRVGLLVVDPQESVKGLLRIGFCGPKLRPGVVSPYIRGCLAPL